MHSRRKPHCRGSRGSAARGGSPQDSTCAAGPAGTGPERTHPTAHGGYLCARDEVKGSVRGVHVKCLFPKLPTRIKNKAKRGPHREELEMPSGAKPRWPGSPAPFVAVSPLSPVPCAAPARAPWPLWDPSLRASPNTNPTVPQAPTQDPRCPRDARRRSLTSAGRRLLDVRFTARSGPEPRAPSRSVCGTSSSARVPQAGASPQKSEKRHRTDAAPAA